MPLERPYCTLKRVQRECINDSPDDAADIVEAINEASRYIERTTRRKFWFQDCLATSSANPALEIPLSWCAVNVIYLPMPVISLTEISVQHGNGEASVMEPGDYRYLNNDLESSAKIMRSGNWVAGDRFSTVGLLPRNLHSMPTKLLLKGTFGYALAADKPNETPPIGIPEDIARACAVIAAVFSGKLKKSFIGEGGTQQQTTQKTIPREISDILNDYRVKVV